MTYTQIINRLHELANEEKISFKQEKFGIQANNSLGIYHQDLKKLIKEIPKSDDLAIKLFDSGIYEARILCSKMYDAKNLTENLMEYWVASFENWEICDSFSMGLFAKSKFAVSKALEWTAREAEFEKRAGFTIIAAYCMADKQAGNEIFEQFLPIIISESIDERLYVKKAVNWALRNIGKRNIDLNRKAIEAANIILNKDTKSAQWIAKDAIRELQNPKVRISDYPREKYRS
ncbi:MAG: DNA alkylation repair protein [Bacteroidales bacterium]|nr:DNA alkylation repair protein [Bacteroidales bacterium]